MAEMGESSSRKRKIAKFVDYNLRAKLPNAEQKKAFDRVIKSHRKVIVTKFLDKHTLSTMRILHIVRDMLERVGLEGHLNMVFPTIPLLTQEFLASLEWVHKYENDDGEEPTIGFMLRNSYCTLTMTKLTEFSCFYNFPLWLFRVLPTEQPT